jgi:hypothetical protein
MFIIIEVARSATDLFLGVRIYFFKIVFRLMFLVLTDISTVFSKVFSYRLKMNFLPIKFDILLKTRVFVSSYCIWICRLLTNLNKFCFMRIYLF